MSNGFFYEIHDNVTGILQVDQQPTSSMTMAKLHLGLSIARASYKSTSSRPPP